MEEGDGSPKKGGTLRNPGFVIYRYMIAGVTAFLPWPLAYGFSRFYGLTFFRLSTRAREKVLHNLEWFSLGGTTKEKRLEVARGYFVLRCCEVMEDLMMLRGPGALSRNVEIEGLEHLRASLGEGKGVVLCGAHFGSYRSSLSLMGAVGYPVTPIMRRPTSLGSGASLPQRMLYWARSYALLRYMRRQNIPVQSGESEADVKTALMAAKYLKNGEIVYVNLDATVIRENRARAFKTRFLGKDALFLTGAMAIAKMTGAKVHVMTATRAKDWRHQKLTVSPSISMEGSASDGFQRCLDVIEAAIETHPSHWEMLDLIPDHGTYFPGYSKN